LGIGRQSNGTLTVTDPGSEVVATGKAYIAHAETGTLIVENSGTFLVTLDPVGIGGLTVGNGTTLGVGGSGTATVTSGGLLESEGYVDVGVGGDTGTLTVQGGSVSAEGQLLIGNSITLAPGATLISPTGTAVVASTTVETGTGSVSVTDGTITANSLVLDDDPGLAASGILTIGSAGVVNLLGNGSSNENGTIGLSGGVLNVGTTVASSGDPTLTLNAGATLTGYGQVAIGLSDTGTLVNAGAIAASGGTLELSAGAGSMSIADGAMLRLDDGADPASIVDFSTGAPEILLFNNGLSAVNSFSIGNLQTLDSIEFGDGIVATSATLTGTTLTVDVSGFSSSTIQFTNVGLGGGTSATFTTGIDAITGDSFAQVQSEACFAEGTRIQAAGGPIAVESLRAGDRVTLADGGCEPVVWVGSRAVDCARHPKPESVWPVRVREGAFGPGAPVRDLWLSPDHAVFVDGVLVPVKLLIDGAGIAQVQRDRVTYYHVELPEHALILAEALPVESYLDTGDRADFGRDSGAMRLFPDFGARLAPNTAMIWETRAAAPLVMTGPALEAARGRVANLEKSTAAVDLAAA
jgi:T5SS/PEP-CTERM-associated repeat protein